MPRKSTVQTAPRVTTAPARVSPAPAKAVSAPKRTFPFFGRQSSSTARKLTRKQQNRWERERTLQRIAISATAAIIIAIVLIPGFGYYREVIARGNEEIARVNDVAFKMDAYVNQLRYKQRQIDSQVQFLNQLGGAGGAAQQVAQQRSVLPTQLVFDWVDDEVIRQNAGKLGVTATADDVEAQIRKDMEPPANTSTPDPSQPAPTPTPVPAPFEERYRSMLTYSGITDAEYREMVRTRLLRDKVENKLKESLPTSADQIRVRGILTSQESDAKTVLDRLKNGDSWTDVAKDLSGDSASKDSAGDLGYLPRGVKDDDFDNAVFNLKKGTGPQGPINIKGSYWVFEVIDGPVNRPIDPENLDALKSGAMTKWLTEQKKEENNKVEYKITSDRQLWAQDRLDKERKALQRKLNPGVPIADDNGGGSPLGIPGLNDTGE